MRRQWNNVKSKEDREYRNNLISKFAIGIGIFIILGLIPATRTATVSFVKFSWGLIIWAFLLFVIIFVMKWIILKIK